MRDTRVCGLVVVLCCREKPRREGITRPYPKPTQVVR